MADEGCGQHAARMMGELFSQSWEMHYLKRDNQGALAPLGERVG
jgi:hypothetical protein